MSCGNVRQGPRLTQDQMEITPEIQARLQKLGEKYGAIGQDMLSYLDGLLYSNSLTYWDYIHLDTLLSMQNPRTDFPDEQIFIMYHQITELYFKLIRHELRQLQEGWQNGLDFWFKRIKRIVNYFKNLTQSFDVMVEGMDPEQFLKFRMSLLPASGFQSVQYRQIELESTSVWNLLRPEARHQLDPESSIAEQFPELYWKSGNLELSTGKKTLTLRIFEERYDAELRGLAAQMAPLNIWALYLQLPHDDRENADLKALLKEYDLFANVFWALSHYKSAVRYLQRDPDVIAATGGTNWQKYLPPRFQRVVYFPALWSEEEIAEWGKAWVMELFREKVETNWGKVKRNG
jgi:tryptophan 2,3-dioxygenase